MCIFFGATTPMFQASEPYGVVMKIHVPVLKKYIAMVDYRYQQVIYNVVP